MADDSEEALRKFGLQVLELVRLYRLAANTAERSVVQDFHHQLIVCEALAQVAVLRIVRVENMEDPK